MKTFGGDANLKMLLLKELAWHREQDSIQQRRIGHWGSDNKWSGCAVSCGVRSLKRILGDRGFCDERMWPARHYDHGYYAHFIQVPASLICEQENIFEGLDAVGSLDFPYEFISSIPVGIESSLLEIDYNIVYSSIDEKWVRLYILLCNAQKEHSKLNAIGDTIRCEPYFAEIKKEVNELKIEIAKDRATLLLAHLRSLEPAIALPEPKSAMSTHRWQPTTPRAHVAKPELVERQ